MAFLHTVPNEDAGVLALIFLTVHYHSQYHRPRSPPLFPPCSRIDVERLRLGTNPFKGSIPPFQFPPRVVSPRRGVMKIGPGL